MDFFTYDDNKKVNGVWYWTEKIDDLNGTAMIINGLWEGFFKNGRLIHFKDYISYPYFSPYIISSIKPVGSAWDHNEAIALCQVELDKVTRNVSCN